MNVQKIRFTDCDQFLIHQGLIHTVNVHLFIYHYIVQNISLVAHIYVYYIHVPSCKENLYLNQKNLSL